MPKTLAENGVTEGGKPATNNGYNSAPESGEIAEAEQPAEEVATVLAPSSTGLPDDRVVGEQQGEGTSEQARCALQFDLCACL